MTAPTPDDLPADPDETSEAQPSAGEQSAPSSRRRRVIRFLLLSALIALVLWVLTGLIGDVDWAKVGDALTHLAPWQLAVLIAGLILRQYLNALPLSLFIEGCSPFKAVVNDQAAILLTTTAPPPSDIVMRLAMFGSWGIPATAGLAGTVMNTLTFYMVRFGTPLLGVGLGLVLLGSFDVSELLAALASGAVSLALVAIVWLAFRDARYAAATARGVGRVARRVRRQVDLDVWQTKAVDFRDQVVGQIPTALPRSLASLIAMVVLDATLIVAALRFIGVTSNQLPATEVYVAFMIAYPLTLFPFSGLGILDAVVITALVGAAGDAVEPGIVAALVVWRAVTLIVPLLLGLLSVSGWKWWQLRRS